MDQTVYLCGPISGLTAVQATTWRHQVRHALGPRGYHIIDPMRGHDSRRAEEALRADGKNWPYGPKAVFRRDKHDVLRADILFVNLLGAVRVSAFSMMELAWAEDHNKFVLTVMEDDGSNVHEHLCVREASSLIVPTVAEAVQYLTEVHNQ